MMAPVLLRRLRPNDAAGRKYQSTAKSYLNLLDERVFFIILNRPKWLKHAVLLNQNTFQTVAPLRHCALRTSYP
jgi:hypothetical protein